MRVDEDLGLVVGFPGHFIDLQQVRPYKKRNSHDKMIQVRSKNNFLSLRVEALDFVIKYDLHNQ